MPAPGDSADLPSTSSAITLPKVEAVRACTVHARTVPQAGREWRRMQLHGEQVPRQRYYLDTRTGQLRGTNVPPTRLQPLECASNVPLVCPRMSSTRGTAPRTCGHVHLRVRRIASTKIASVRADGLLARIPTQYACARRKCPEHEQSRGRPLRVVPPNLRAQGRRPDGASFGGPPCLRALGGTVPACG